MNISIGEKEVFGGAASRHKRLKDYRRCWGVTGGIRVGSQWVKPMYDKKVYIILTSWCLSRVARCEVTGKAGTCR